MEDRRPDEASGDVAQAPTASLAQVSTWDTVTEHPTGSVAEPETAHVHGDEVLPENASDNEREATELRALPVSDRKGRRVSRIISPQNLTPHWYNPIKKMWRHYIRLSVPHVDCRDHLANERTFLGYIRTSVALSMLGVTVAQLYRLNPPSSPNMVFGYYVLGIPLAAVLQGTALLMTLIGATRFYRQQHAMSVGRVHAGGREIYAVSILIFLLLVGLLAIHIGIIIYKEE